MSAYQGTKLDGPSFCWHCNKQLHRAPGKGKGLFFFGLVAGSDGIKRRVHDSCVKRAIQEGAKAVE